MTTDHAAARLRRPTREQCIAALLVGAVVILLGFASGLGIVPAADPVAAQAGSVSLGPGSATPDPATTGASTTAPAAGIAYVVPPAAAPPAGVGAAPVPASAPATGTPTPPAPGSSHTRPTAAPTPRSTATSTATSSPTSTPPSCPPDVLTTLVTALLPDGSAPGSGDVLGVLQSILDPGSAATTLLRLPTSDLRRQVGVLLARPDVAAQAGAAESSATSLTGGCTDEVGAVLRALSDGSDIASAVRAVSP